MTTKRQYFQRYRKFHLKGRLFSTINNFKGIRFYEGLLSHKEKSQLDTVIEILTNLQRDYDFYTKLLEAKLK